MSNIEEGPADAQQTFRLFSSVGDIFPKVLIARRRFNTHHFSC